jgi:hypothetical protein
VSVGVSRPGEVPPPREYSLWRLTMNGHVVDAVARQVPRGTELRLSVNHKLWWCRVFSDGHGHLLGEKAEELRGQFTERGWA